MSYIKNEINKVNKLELLILNYAKERLIEKGEIH
jgi:hypothetical protein